MNSWSVMGIALLVGCGATPEPRPSGREASVPEAGCSIVRVVRVPAPVLSALAPHDAASIASWAAAHREEIDAEMGDAALRYADLGELVRAAHVLFAVAPDASPEARAEASARAEAALRRALAGQDFGALARELSEDPATAAFGGELGWLPRGRMEEEIDEVAFAGSIGVVPSVVESRYGFHLIEVRAHHPGGDLPEEEVRGEVVRELYAPASARAGRARLIAVVEAAPPGATLDELLASVLGPSPAIREVRSEPVGPDSTSVHTATYAVTGAPIEQVRALEPGELLPRVLGRDDEAILIEGASRYPADAPECAAPAPAPEPTAEERLEALRRAMEGR